MKLKLLLLSLLMTVGILNAQDDTIRSVVISEARIDNAHNAYAEITNVGDAPVNLKDFEFGHVTPWILPYAPGEGYYMRLPDRILDVNESFVIAMIWDWEPQMYLMDPDHYSEMRSKPDLVDLADLQIHGQEANTGPGDSISPYAQIMTDVWGGRSCWYLEYHVGGDSAVIDQVNGIFDGDNGYSRAVAHDVAGITNASANHILVRKFSYKAGNLNFDEGRGQDIGESEWIPIPFPLAFTDWDAHRKSFWTVGNHGNYLLDDASFVPDVAGLSVDWTNNVITVPYGIRNNDSLMMAFKYHEGLAWHYDLAENSEDSAFISARSGDKLTVFACGNDLQSRVFTVELSAPTAGENRVMPKSGKNNQGIFPDDPGPAYRVSDGLVMDTISRVPFATRTDTLQKYLEKAPNADWVIVYNPAVNGGVERPDLVDGDILRVIPESGTNKEYYIKVLDYAPSHNAQLRSITWPDIPDFIRGNYGWSADTIPSFAPTKYNYKIDLPTGVTTVPALLATPENPNTKITVERAAYIYGGPNDRTITFNTLAEDDSTDLAYKVQITVKKDPALTQPYTTGEAFISQLVLRETWSNTFIEICNPRGIPMDMSDYMVVAGGGDPPDAILQGYELAEDSTRRYRRYTPGYKWADPAEWAINPSIMIQDVNTNPLTQPGDVFVLSAHSESYAGDHWLHDQVDFNFTMPPFDIEFQMTFHDWDMTGGGNGGEDRNPCSLWMNNTIYLYKIENPEVKAGTKAADDPADFRLVDVFGHGDYSNWNIGGAGSNQNAGWTRKPQYYKGTPGFGESFGTDEATNQWILFNEAYYNAMGVGYPQNNSLISDGIGSHYLLDITEHLSTITSRYYEISAGYSADETISGIITGITAEEFYANIAKSDENQQWSIMSGVTSGLELTGTDLLGDQDTLIVVSANGNNTTKYALSVSSVGLSSDATLTSTAYTIGITGETGTVSGFDYGTLLKDVVANVTAPEKSTLTVVDEFGAYVPMKQYNLDTVLIDVLATDKVYFDVVAQNGIAKIVYQLIPNSLATDAFVLSQVYGVDQDQLLIEFIPEGTTVPTFKKNLIPAVGATIKVIDKAGFERVSGILVKDDQLVVTAADGSTTATYNIVFLIPDEEFLAYVTSSVYTVDQNNMEITANIEKISISTTTDEFLGNLKPAASASTTVLHSDMSENTTGNMVVGDIVEVLSGNQLKVVYYDVVVDPVSVENELARSIQIYPNPSSGVVHVIGLESGNRLQVFNATGQRIRDRVVYSSEEIISLEEQPDGFYFVVVRDNDGIIGNYKLIIQ